MWGVKAGRLASVMVLMLMVMPGDAMAAGLTNRSDTVSTAQAGVTATHVMSFTTATTSNIGSIGFLFCTTATGACTMPGGLLTNVATLIGQTGVTAFTLNASNNGEPIVSNGTTPSVAANTAISFTMSGITNPTAINDSFYVRITTYTGTDGATGPVDTGNVAVSTSQPVQLTGVTPEILVFCVGTSITGNCTTVSGNAIDFGDFSPVSTSTGTSVMQAQTNAGSGYAITVNGTTLASGVNTIPALTTQTASTAGSSQFGLNLTANTAPAVGAVLSGGGTGSVTANYNTQNQFRFNSGDPVATAAVPTNANTYTSSYIVNIGGMQAAGVYTATMTYICTAAF